VRHLAPIRWGLPVRALAAGALAVVVVVGGCARKSPRPDPAASTGAKLTSRGGKGGGKSGRELSRGAARVAHREKEPAAATERIKPLRRCFPEDTALSEPRSHDALMDRAGARFDVGDYEGALVCAEEATRESPDSVEAHHGRAVALAQLGHLDQARDAITRALALDPNDAETLTAAADLYVNRLGPSTELTEVGLAYAQRAARLLRRSHHSRLAARVALLEGQALNDLGRANEALPHIEQALQGRPHDLEAQYERAVSLFELCRFAEARAGLEAVLHRDPDHAYAHHFLALVLERSDDPSASAHFARARALRPRDFPPPVVLGAAEFQRLVDGVIADLPADVRAALKRVPLEIVDLPSSQDLTAEAPPLSPTVLGLFRGLPEGVTCKPAPGGAPIPARSIVLYRRNLARTVTSVAALRREVRKTLLHEVGHLRGEDDASLRARGLE
jgi:Flp pilus assembly protein TadD/predicted Zn-dependent protease with MMP-like domain